MEPPLNLLGEHSPELPAALQREDVVAHVNQAAGGHEAPVYLRNYFPHFLGIRESLLPHC